MADDDPKDRRWLAEMPQLERLLSAAELDTPPTSLEARLLQGLREAELLEAELHVMSSPEGPPPSSPEAGGNRVDGAVTAAEPEHLASASGSWLHGKPVWMVAGIAVLSAAAGALLWWGPFPDQSRALKSMLNASPSNGDTAAEHSSSVACTGTYVIEESNGSMNLWTFHLDGTMVNTSFGERAHNFGTQHGTWKALGPLSARATQLDLHWAPDGTLSGIGRVDITIRGDKGSCDTVVGEFSGRLFETGEDFRRTETDSGEPFKYTFTGFRLEVTP